MTGQVDVLRRTRSTVSCWKVRRTTASTYWLMVRAKSATLSRVPRPTSLPREEDAGAAELGHGRLEADARAQRRLLEDQAEDLARQQRLVACPLRGAFLSCAASSSSLRDLVAGSDRAGRESVAWLSDQRVVRLAVVAPCADGSAARRSGLMRQQHLFQDVAARVELRRRSGSGPAAAGARCRACS